MSAWSVEELKGVAKQLQGVIAKENWQKDKSNSQQLCKLMASLVSYRPDYTTLAESKLGVVVNKLRKHSEDCVRGYAGTLTDKWKSALDIKTSSKTSSTPSTTTSTIDNERKENARNRLASSYAEHKAQKVARRSKFIDQPLVKKKGRKSTSNITITRFVNPQRAQAKIVRTMGNTMQKTLPTQKTSAYTRPATSIRPRVTKPLTDEERHLQRQQKLRAIAEQKAIETGKKPPPPLRENTSTINRDNSTVNVSSISSTSQDPRKMYTRIASAAENAAKAKTSPAKVTKNAAPPPQESERKQFLNKMYTRVAYTAPDTNPQKRKRGDEAPEKATKKPWTESQRDVVHWLKGLDDDMSQYCEAFFENGFDSMKLVATITEKDLPSMIPKKGHCRLIESAIENLKKKSRKPEVKRQKKSYDYYDDEDQYETDDGFIVSADEEDDVYRPGSIYGAFRRGRKRRYSMDSDDISDMEATPAQIRAEERRTREIGDMEDEREARREREHKLQKAKKKRDK
ncbi:hypothetical protein THRCLA_21254 [Thraustotheca clavata]|uniref:TFIIS N-terminal domain-containing protein n=1 Tax=Thraustotheca clavata TaxID=74557 RepID=A0A1V9ZYG3_9STRA|nr:hypothetical protein THRCLA_21254 [Thraustotheca clavata]